MIFISFKSFNIGLVLDVSSIILCFDTLSILDVDRYIIVSQSE